MNTTVYRGAALITLIFFSGGDILFLPQNLIRAENTEYNCALFLKVTGLDKYISSSWQNLKLLVLLPTLSMNSRASPNIRAGEIGGSPCPFYAMQREAHQNGVPVGFHWKCVLGGFRGGVWAPKASSPT